MYYLKAIGLLCLFIFAARLGSAQIIDTALLGEREVIYEVMDSNNLQYKWEVEDGIIVSGQGTAKIKVDWPYSAGLKKISVHARPMGNCLPDTSIAYIWVMELEAVFIPNSFTPNGDGLNDEFRPLLNLNGIKNYRLTVVNRWGQIVFDTQDPLKAWNGNDDSAQRLDGVFTCLLELQKENGYRYSSTQLVSIVR